MKHMKKLASLLLALVMVMGLATTAFAAPETGSITIENAVVGQNYAVYQILDLESYNVDNTTTGDGQYAYKATKDWSNFINGSGIKGTYVNVDDQGYVTWVDGASAAEFAKKAKKYADDNNITPGYYDNYNKEATFVEVEPVTATNTTVYFQGLDLGYYLVDSTMGTLCSLDTTNPDATIKEKNVAPTVDKKADGGLSNSAAIGDTVNFTCTITAQAGAQNYVFHDKMSDGLTFGTVTGITLNGSSVDNTNYKAYVVDDSPTDNDTFDIKFTQNFCDTLKANDKIVISYTATVNENAVVGNDDNTGGNKNESSLTYGEENTLTTTPSETKTYTWDVDVFKYTMDGKTEKPLAGAAFTLSKNSDGSNPIELIDKSNGVFRVATAAEIKDNKTYTTTKSYTGDNGTVTIEGLDSGTYYLTETVAPAGYNKLADPIKIVISDTGAVTVDSSTTSVDVVKVLNQTGNELPNTGGMGTTIFYVVGSILLIGAAVLLVTKKRMSAEK